MKQLTEDERVGWHHQLNRYEFEQTLGDSWHREAGMRQSMGLQKVGHDLVTEQQQMR